MAEESNLVGRFKPDSPFSERSAFEIIGYDRNAWKLIDNFVGSIVQIQGLYSLSGRTSYNKISWSLVVTGFGFKLIQLALKFDRHLGSSAAEMPVKF